MNVGILKSLGVWFFTRLLLKILILRTGPLS